MFYIGSNKEGPLFAFEQRIFFWKTEFKSDRRDKQEHYSSITNSFFDIIDAWQDIDRKILLVIYT
ncbi:hypothetical protein ACS95_03685 [Bacillus cereus]|nr:hypothetical protein ACS95_03685 [Bacillus cereus]